jgi:hypothetical protein
MKVLMFGWEFHPHISEGPGTACSLKQITGDVAATRINTLYYEIANQH